MTTDLSRHPHFIELKRRLGEIEDLRGASELLAWDQATFMPPAGSDTRGRQLSILNRLSHERRTDPRLGTLLDGLEAIAEGLPDGAVEARLIKVARRDFEKANRVPPEFVARLSRHQTEAYDRWKQAREANDFEVVRPQLERTLELSRERAEFAAGYESIADPLIDDLDEGITAQWTRRLFGELRALLVPLVDVVCEQPVPDTACLRGPFSETAQLDWIREVVDRIGYSFERGRIDTTEHPFMARFGGGDIRITTRIAEHDLSHGLFAAIHEAGHALYEQGISADLDGTPLGHGTSASVHESQSRLWENLVGRGRHFWRFHYPALQSRFPEAFGAVSEEAFYRAINRVQRSLIRVHADELSYNLHVMLRFELELDMLEGRLAVADLPERWADQVEADIGVRPPDHNRGVLQDVHWFCDVIGGMFQCYTLGNVMSAQFYEAALADEPEIPDDIAQGKFDRLRGWLRTHVYRPGRSVDALALVEQATGRPLSIDAYGRYLRQKYGELYDL